MGIDLEKAKKAIHDFDTIKDENGLTASDRWFIKQNKAETYRKRWVSKVKDWVFENRDTLPYKRLSELTRNGKCRQLLSIVDGVWCEIGEDCSDEHDDFTNIIFNGIGLRSFMGCMPQIDYYIYYNKPRLIEYKQHVRGDSSDEDGKGLCIKLGYKTLPYNISKGANDKKWTIDYYGDNIKFKQCPSKSEVLTTCVSHYRNKLNDERNRIESILNML